MVSFMKIKSASLALIAFLVIFVVLPAVFIQINNRFSLPEFSHLFLKVIGIFLIFLGVLPGMYTFVIFRKVGKGTPIPVEPPKKLVIEGLHCYCRNPMYVGYMAILFGIAFLFGHVLLFGYAVLMMIFIHFTVVMIEEPILRKRFGSEYDAYASQVPRWFRFKF